MDIMDIMDAMDLTFNGQMDRHKKTHLLYVSIPVHCPFSSPFLSIRSIVSIPVPVHRP